jgi:hypothetical protein
MTKAAKNNGTSYNHDTLPTATGVYDIVYSRAKSREIHLGKGKFVKSKKRFTEITGKRGHVGVSYDARDNRFVEPKVIGWK